MFKNEFWFPEQVNAMAAGTDDLFMFILWVSVISMALILGFMGWFAIKYRAGNYTNTEPHVTHNFKLELAWTVIPTIILLVIWYWGTVDYVAMSVPKENSMEIRVTGQKWFWTFDYPEHGVRLRATAENDEQRRLDNLPVGLVVPVNTPVKLVGSAVDVLHSVYIPAFRVKKDMVPERYTVAAFEATQEGEYDLFCTEYCGTKHSGMITKATVVSQEAFDKLMEAEKAKQEGPVDGATVFAQSGCAGCHTVTPNGASGVGPALHGLYGRQENLNDGTTVLADENYIRESIMKPLAKVVQGYSPVMPSYSGQLSEDELNAVVLYIRSLGRDDGGAL